ncbi:hypothetical protein Tco_1515141 [Tanacetum coccineum]
MPNPPLDKEDSSLNEIMDDLFRIGDENIRKMEYEVPNRCDDETVDENIDISIAKEKEEVQVEDVEMDKDYDIDHSNT